MPKPNNTKEITHKLIESWLKESFVGDTLADVGRYSGLRLTKGKLGYSWCYRYLAYTGKTKQVPIGKFESVGLSEARVKLREFKNLRTEGTDPAEYVKEIKQAKIDEADKLKSERYSVSDMMNHFINEGLLNRQEKGRKEAERLIKKDIIKPFGRSSIFKLTKAKVFENMQSIIKRGAPIQAKAMVREFKAGFEHAVNAGRIPEHIRNPCDKIKTPQSKSRKRYLSTDELVTFLNWLPVSCMSKNTIYVLHLSLLTGCRSGEITSLNWNQVDLDRGEVSLPITKNGEPRNVQLSTQAISILQKIKGNSTSDWVFPSDKKPYNAIRQHSVVLQVLYWRDFSNLEHWSAHDLRRTCRTHLSRLGCPLEVAESILGHVKGGIEGTYDLHRYEPEQKAWLQKWADFLDKIIKEP